MRTYLKGFIGAVILSITFAPAFWRKPQPKIACPSPTPLSASVGQNSSAKYFGHRPIARNSSGLAHQTDLSATAQAPAAPHPEAFDAFTHWWGEYETAAVKTETLEQAGESIAIERRAAMAELIESDPERALQLAVPYEIRKGAPASVARQLEEQVSGYARYDVIGVLARDNQQNAIERYVTLNDRTYKASVYGRRVAQMTEPSIPVYGIAIGNAIALAEHPVRVLGTAEAAGRAASAPAAAKVCPISKAPGKVTLAAEVGGEVRYFCHDGHIEALNKSLEESESGPLTRQSLVPVNPGRSTGEKSFLLIRVNFPDDPAETISFDAAVELMQNANAFIRKNSYGQLSITSTITPLLTMPRESAWYRSGDLQRVLDDARAIALVAGFDDAKFDYYGVHIDGTVLSAQAYIGGRGLALDNSSVTRACHEIGHNLGLSHAMGWETTDGSVIGAGRNRDYANPFDTMGGSREEGQFNICHKFMLNWLPASAVQTITADGIYRLYPFDVDSLQAGRTYALKLTKDNDRDYWIETRQNGGGSLEPGDLLINWSPWYMSGGGSQLLDMNPLPEDSGFLDAQLKLGRSFYDPELGIKIIPQRLAGTEPGAVDVLVKHVHYLALQMENADLSNGYASTDEPSASGTQAVNLAPGGSALFQMQVAQAGDYSVWCRMEGLAAAFSLAVDGVEKTENISFDGAGGSDWRWARIVEQPAGFPIVPVVLTLTAGSHTLRVSGGSESTKVDALLLADDPTNEFPPVFAPIPDQVTTIGKPVNISSSTFLGGAARGRLQITAASSNELLVPEANIAIDGNDLNQRITVAPDARRLGTTVITLSAVAPDGSSGTTSFRVSVIGEIQALIDAAAPGDSIRLPGGIHIDHMVINKNLSLEGSSASDTILDGNKDDFTLVISANASVTLKNLTIRNGHGGIHNFGVAHLVQCEIDQNLNAPRGGGIWNEVGATLFLERCTLSSNRCSFQGGGICNLGTMSVLDSTISANRSTTADGGGVFNGGTAQFVHCTIASNRAAGGGGVANTNLVDIGNSIVAGNIADSEESADLKGDFVSRGYNLIQVEAGFEFRGDLAGNILGQAPALGPLRNNGGPTLTRALLDGSPAIDAGSADGLDVDERGSARVVDAPGSPNAQDGSDIGAVEFAPTSTDGGDLAGSATAAHLSMRKDADGTVIITVDRGGTAAWVLQASSDFQSWEVVGLFQQGQSGELTDPKAGEAGMRFYRAVQY